MTQGDDQPPNEGGRQGWQPQDWQPQDWGQQGWPSGQQQAGERAQGSSPESGGGSGLTGTDWLYEHTERPRSQPTATDPVSFMPPAGSDPYATQTGAQPPPQYPPHPPYLGSPPGVPPRRRRRRWPIVLGAVIVGVVLVLVAADRITPVVIGRQVGSNLKSELSTRSRPDVSFGGFPFLTQLGSRHFHQVKISADDVPVSGNSKKLTVGTVDATLHDVRASQGYSKLHIRSARGSAKVSYSKLSSYLGVDVAAGSKPGQIRLKLPGSVVVTGVPAINKQDHKVGLENTKFKIGGHQLPGNRFTGMLRGVFQSKIPDTGELQLDDIAAHDDGIVVKGSGKDITTTR